MGSAFRSAFEMAGSTSKDRASRSYRQVVPAQRWQALPRLKERKRTRRNERSQPRREAAVREPLIQSGARAGFAGEGLRGETVVIGGVFAFAILFASTVSC
jgi:hypothetical protein